MCLLLTSMNVDYNFHRLVPEFRVSCISQYPYPLKVVFEKPLAVSIPDIQYSLDSSWIFFADPGSLSA